MVQHSVLLRDPNDISDAVAELRETFCNTKTNDLTWRRKQLLQLQKLIINHRDEIVQAQYKDLGKDYFGGYFMEINPVEREIQESLGKKIYLFYIFTNISQSLQNFCFLIIIYVIYIDYMDDWVKDIPCPGDVVNLPSRQHIHPEPLGVVLICGAWNFPIQLTFAPLIAGKTSFSSNICSFSKNCRLIHL